MINSNHKNHKNEQLLDMILILKIDSVIIEILILFYCMVLRRRNFIQKDFQQALTNSRGDRG